MGICKRHIKGTVVDYTQLLGGSVSDPLWISVTQPKPLISSLTTSRLNGRYGGCSGVTTYSRNTPPPSAHNTVSRPVAP